MSDRLDFWALPIGAKVRFSCGCIGTRVPCPYGGYWGIRMKDYPWFHIPSSDECTIHSPDGTPTIKWQPPGAAVGAMIVEENPA